MYGKVVEVLSVPETLLAPVEVTSDVAEPIAPPIGSPVVEVAAEVRSPGTVAGVVILSDEAPEMLGNGLLNVLTWDKVAEA